MSTTPVDPSANVYDRLMKLIFSGQFAPGRKLVERDLAQELGVSRIPVRESLSKMVAQGLLLGGEKWQGVRLRTYTPEEISQLYDYREFLEGAAARTAASALSDADLVRLQLICEEGQAEVGNYGSARWAELDHHFHAAIAEASHNDRIARALTLLLTECHYAFYLYPAHRGRIAPSRDDARAHMQSIVDDHRALVELIRAGDAEGAEQRARADMRKSKRRVTRALIVRDLE
jgi:DNA-binding GntR family transcriptional regulator